MATAQLVGQDCLAGMDRVRADPGSALLSEAPVAPSTTAGRLAGCFGRERLLGIDVGLAQIYTRWLAHGAVKLGCDFAIAAKRNSAAWRAFSAIPEATWQDARGMEDAQVAACDYAPAGWPDETYTIVRRVKVPVEQLSADPRSRRRRTVQKDQLALALGGAADHVWAVSFIVTNIPANHADLIGLEAWFRNRTSIEERFREGKHGAGLNHLPSADADVNSVWAWAGLLAGALSVMLQS